MGAVSQGFILVPPKVRFWDVNLFPFSTAVSPAVLIICVMDSGACADQSNQCQGLSRNFSEKLYEVRNKEAAAELSTMADEAAPQGPITPVLKREVVDVPFDCDSPLTEATKVSLFVVETITKEDQVASVSDGSPRTPKDVVFDPFAPGPDHLAMAPLCKKYVYQMKTSAARRLNFDSSLKLMEDGTDVDDMESISDEEMFESVYNNLLEAIVSKQTEDLLTEISNVEWDPDSCKTPPTTQLSGIAETCPGAPMKPSAKSRKIDLDLCRKLEF